MKEEKLIQDGLGLFHDLFFPQSVAIIGASRKKGKVGYEVLNNILTSGFPGNVYPVNPSADEILGIKCYRSVLDIPAEVNLCIISIPAEHIIKAVEECGEKGVKLAVVLTAGFREKGPEGARLEKEITEKARARGMRILGPNCLGFINTILPLNASFAPSMPHRGGIGFISQSGALITSAIDWSLGTGAGFSLMFSIGNRADLDEVELLEFFAEHEDTRAVAMYIESSAKGRELVEAASKVAVKKPVFILRGGVSEAGVRAASSHTGSIAGSREAWKAGIARAGAVEVESFSELLNASWIACSSNPPSGNRVLILTNAGGAGIITSDLIEHRTGGVLKVASLPQEMVKEIKEALPPEASPANPVDVLGDAGPERFERVMEIVTKNRGVDSVLLVITPQAMTDVKKIAESTLRYSEKIPVIGVFIGGDRAEEGRRAFIEKGLSAFAFPEDAVKALAGYHRAVREKSVISLTLKTFRDTYPARVKEVLKRAVEDGRNHLMEIEALDILKAYGISTPRRHLATTADEAVLAAKEIGFPVVLKIASPDIIHKTEIGGVIVGIEDTLSLQHAYSSLILRVREKLPEARIVGVVVEEMVSGITEVIVGMRRDPDFGPLIMFGLGGIFVEILRDVSYRLAPLTEESVERIFQEVRSIPLLKGFRGRKRGDIEALKETLLRFSQLVVENEEILELEINPLIVREEGKGVVALDARGTFSGR